MAVSIVRAVTDGRIAFALGVAGALVYLVTGIGLGTDYDYYGRLAHALVEGRWWLTDAPSWLNELLVCGDGRWCVAYPPMPALLAIPIAFVASSATAQVVVSRIAGGSSAGILYLALRAFGAPRAVALAGVLLSTLGTTLYFSSVDGRAWYAGHAVAMPFLSLAFLFAARGERPWLIGAMVGMATLARLPVAAAAPALALLAARRGDMPFTRALAGVILGGAPFALVYLGYNQLRWGTPFDEGYARLSEGDVFFTRGLFSPLYLPRQLYAMFLVPPDFVDNTVFFLRPRFEGMSLIVTTPAFLWVFAALRAVRRDAAVGATALAALLALLPDLLHGSYGFQQFGYRFSIDAQPFLVALALVGDARGRAGWRARPSWLFIGTVVLSVAINLYATIGITRFDYWQ